MKLTLKFVGLIFALVAVFAFASFVRAAFVEPSNSFPGSAPAAPLDTSSLFQTKVGGLQVQTMGVNTAPQRTLDVAGTFRVSGLGEFGSLNVSGSSSVSGNVQWSGSLTGGSVPWGRLTSFPPACPSGQAITALGATITCATAGTPSQWTDVTGGGIYYNGGNVGIGTASPGQKLDVADRARFRAATSSAGFWLTDSAGAENVFTGLQGNASTSAWGVYSSGAWKLTLTNAGNVGIGTTDPGTYKLRVEGSAFSTGGWESSDVRLKKNVAGLTDVLSKVLNLTGVYYDWRTSEYPTRGLPEGRQIGLIAQEVEKVFPELVSTDSDGYKALAYDRLSAILLEAVKEQQVQIEELEMRLKKLEDSN